LATTDALFADNVEGKVSNPLARFGAGRSFLDRTKLAAVLNPDAEEFGRSQRFESVRGFKLRCDEPETLAALAGMCGTTRDLVSYARHPAALLRRSA
jgi:hypothetical protein